MRRKQGEKRCNRVVLTVYLSLRLIVIASLTVQLAEQNFENAFICILTLLLFQTPSFLERRLKVVLPDVLEIMILVFIFAAQIMGEIQEYYLTVPYWDILLHGCNGFLFAAIGFSMVNVLNENKSASFSLSPLYMAMTAFCFSMTIGILWEFFEWGMDSWFGTDMQKDTVISGFQSVLLNPLGHNVPCAVTEIRNTVLIHEDGSSTALNLGGYLDIGLLDTMTDLLVNFLGAVLFFPIGFFYVKSKGKGRLAQLLIPRAENGDKTRSSG